MNPEKVENLKLLHSTKPYGPDDPIQVVFSVTENGREMIVPGECPAQELYAVFHQKGWLGKITLQKTVTTGAKRGPKPKITNIRTGTSG